MKEPNKFPNSATLPNSGATTIYLIVTLPKKQKQEEISNDLTFSHFDIDKDFANKFKKAAKGLSNLPVLANEIKKSTSVDLGINALYLIATLSEERTDEQRVRR
ncbi:hypothetical protein P7H42_10065 [Vagococcus lutrae]|nr:hypothetical protein [Vagococcus lutrae]